MGRFLNPGNSGFERILRGQYIDKTGLISLINDTIDTPDCLTCISRPRRFGKTYAAQMLCAYYDKTCDSAALFKDKIIGKCDSFEDHMNRYDILYVDMTNIKSETDGYNRVEDYLSHAIKKELKSFYPQLDIEQDFISLLIHTTELSGNKFIMIIDEWDAPIRENPCVQREYLEFLRALFKGSGTTARIFAAVYMTGILPIKKDGSQSAISDFMEYSVLSPGAFAAYTGFTEEEVFRLCKENDMSFEEARRWYDGYSLSGIDTIYNPFSVMCAIKNRRFTSYWIKTSAAEALATYIDLDQEGLQDDIVKLISGEMIEVDPDGFENDFETFNSKDDVLTLLIHLGYLSYKEIEDGYDEDTYRREYTGFVSIPNEEVRQEFKKILRKGKHRELRKLISKSDELLQDTLARHEEKVAKAISDLRDSEYAPAFYNDEQALRYIIKFAYISCIDQYLKIEELPSGHGLADIVFVPKRHSSLPAMIVELKWNKSSIGAIRQIKSRHYPAALERYGGEILLVGINYDDRTKEHTCMIETYQGNYKDR